MSIGQLRQRAQEWVSNTDISYLYSVSLFETLRSAPHPHPELRVIICEAANLDIVEDTLPGLPSVISSYVRRGNLAFLAATEREWVFRSLAILGPRIYPIHGYPLALTVRDVYLEAAETHPVWRGKGVAPGMLRVTAYELLERGYANAYLTISTYNTASCRAAEKGGAKRQGIITARRRLGHWDARFNRFAPPLPPDEELLDQELAA